MGICQEMSENEGNIYDFVLKSNEKRNGYIWDRPRLFSSEDGEEKPRSNLKELMYVISKR